MKEPVVLRYFYDEEKAKEACQIVMSNEFECELLEDKFNDTSFDKFGMRRRFKVMVELKDYNKIAEFLAKKLRSRRLG